MLIARNNEGVWYSFVTFQIFLFLEYNIFPPAVFLHRKNLKRVYKESINHELGLSAEALII